MIFVSQINSIELHILEVPGLQAGFLIFELNSNYNPSYFTLLWHKSRH